MTREQLPWRHWSSTKTLLEITAKKNDSLYEKSNKKPNNEQSEFQQRLAASRKAHNFTVLSKKQERAKEK